ncbi:CPBP family intramembrane glutamic endopeptidase [Paenibacillus sp. NPDC058071]|uniref:CPBP family intramembrane glutamic endopeptidase n=1 Tax=Paenibacillus sp. NPDC058071 TaxID=3346326 RepID=UPI0036DA78E4
MQNRDYKMILQYLLFTFLITYLAWGCLILGSQFGGIEMGTPVGVILHIIGGNAPPLIAYFVLRKHGRVTGFRSFMKSAFTVKEPLLMYMVVLVLTAVYFGLPALMGGITNSWPVYIAVLSIPVMVIGGGLEELGWRYILQPILETRFSFITSTVITSCIWAVWHLPLFFIPGTSQYNWSFGLFSISILGMSFALAVIYRVSGSIWLCILFHSMINAFSASWAMDEKLWVKLGTTSGLIITALCLLIMLYRRAPVKSVGKHAG